MFARPAAHSDDFGLREKLNALVAEDLLHLIRDVGILPAYQPGSGLDDRHAAAKAPVSLRHFETDIAASEDDQVRRQVVEFERFDVRERPGGLETGNGGYCRVRANVEKNLLARQHAGAAVLQANLQCLWRHKAPIPNDQFGAGRPEVLQMQIDLASDHSALAAQNSRHVGRDGTGCHAKLRAVLREVRHPRTPNLGLAGHAGDGGAGAGNPAALHQRSPPPRLRQMPGDQLTSLSAPEDQYVELFELRHDFLRVLIDLVVSVSLPGCYARTGVMTLAGND